MPIHIGPCFVGHLWHTKFVVGHFSAKVTGKLKHNELGDER